MLHWLLGVSLFDVGGVVEEITGVVSREDVSNAIDIVALFVEEITSELFTVTTAMNWGEGLVDSTELLDLFSDWRFVELPIFYWVELLVFTLLLFANMLIPRGATV